MKEYHLNTKIIEMYKFQQLLLRIIPQTLQFSRKLKEAMSQDYFSGKHSLARLSCILQSFSSKSDRQDTIVAIPRCQGLSSSRKEGRPWERGCRPLFQ